SVCRRGRPVPGAGGLIDVTQSARLVWFCLTLEGRNEKFINRVDHLTFSADQASKNEQEILYVTERAVFSLEASGLRLIEIAPGVDVDELLRRIPFAVAVPDAPALMPADIFQASVGPVV